MPRGRSVLLALLTVVSFAPTATAHGQEPDGRDDAGGRLAITDDGRQGLCVRLIPGAQDPGAGGTVQSCGPVPRGFDRPPLVVTGERQVAGVVAADGARVEVLIAGLAPLSAQTAAPTAERPASARGRVRSFSIALPAPEGRRRGDVEAYAVRVLDGAGRLVGLYDDERSRPAVRGPFRVAYATPSGAAVSFTAERRSALTPTPADPEHRRPVACVRIAFLDEVAGSCVPSGAAESLLFASGCSTPSGAGLVAHVQPGTRSVLAVLGDGSARRATLVDLTSRLDLTTVVAAVALAGDEAVRRLELLGPGPRRRTVVLGFAPAAVECGGFGGGALVSVPTPPRRAAEPVALRGPATRVTDADGRSVSVGEATDGRLCVTLGDPPGEETCGGLVRSIYDVQLRTDVGGILVATLPARIAAAEVVQSDGRVRRFMTLPVPPASAYASSTRLLLADSAPDTVSTGVRLLDRAGDVVGTLRVPLSLPFVVPPRRLAELPGGARLWDVRVAEPGERTVPRVVPERSTCLVADRRAPRVDDDCRRVSVPTRSDLESSVSLAVSCATRRPVLAVGLGHRQSGLTAHLAGGGIRRAETFRTPTGRVAVLVLRPAEAIRRLRIPGRRSRSAEVAVPSGGSQCGYQGTARLAGRSGSSSAP